MKTTHTHHIIPTHMGGSDDPSNLKELTIKQHARAHKKLYKQHGKWEDRIAYQMLSGQITNYEAGREACRLANLGNTHFKGHTHTDKHKKKLSLIMSERRKTIQTMGNFKPHTEEAKKKIAVGMTGNINKVGPSGKQKNPYKGKRTWLMGENNVSKRPEVREKLRQAALNRYK